MATADNKNDYFSGLTAIVLSSAAASSAVFLLFGAFLEHLVPPYVDRDQTVAFASFGTAIILLVLSLAIRKRLTDAKVQTLGIVCGVLLALAVVLFSFFRDGTRTYVYRYPPMSQASDTQKLHIRGDLHVRGRELVGNKTVAQAVTELGGPDFVNSQGLLWTEQSRNARITSFEVQYLALAMLLTTTLFVAAIALWRMSAVKKERASPK